MLKRSAEDGTTGCFWISDSFFDETSNELSIQCSTVPVDVDTASCNTCQEKACLFDLNVDPCEYYDLSENDEYKEIYAQMIAKLKDYYDQQLFAWDGMFGTDYENADPSLFDNFWSPWLSYSQLMDKQVLQYQVYVKNFYESKGSIPNNNNNDNDDGEDVYIHHSKNRNMNINVNNDNINNNNNTFYNNSLSLTTVVSMVIIVSSLFIFWIIKKKYLNKLNTNKISETEPLLKINSNDDNVTNYNGTSFQPILPVQSL